MKTILYIIRKYFSSGFLILLAYPLFKSAFPTNSYLTSRCALGDPSFLSYVLLLPIAAIVIFTMLLVALYRLLNGLSFNYAPYYTLGLLCMAYYFLHMTYPEIIFGKAVLSARSSHSKADIDMTITDKNYVVLKMFNGTRGIVHISSMEENHDTICINGDMEGEIKYLEMDTETLSNKYLIDLPHQKFYPLKSFGLKDTNSYLNICNSKLSL